MLDFTPIAAVMLTRKTRHLMKIKKSLSREKPMVIQSFEY